MDFRGNKQSTTDAERQARSVAIRVNVNERLDALESCVNRNLAYQSLVHKPDTWNRIRGIVDGFRSIKPQLAALRRHLKSVNQSVVDVLKNEHPESFQLEGRKHAYGLIEDSKDSLGHLYAELNQRYATFLEQLGALEDSHRRLSDFKEVKRLLAEDVGRSVTIAQNRLSDFKRAHGITKIAGLTFGAQGECEVRVRVEIGKRAAPAADTPPKKRITPERVLPAEPAVAPAVVPVNAITVEDLLAE